MVVAYDQKNGFGYKGNLPWPKNKKDLAHFKKLTVNNCIVMGRKEVVSHGS